MPESHDHLCSENTRHIEVEISFKVFLMYFVRKNKTKSIYKGFGHVSGAEIL